MSKYHFIYKTTNIITKKFYIGMHSTSLLNDGYVGSGKYLKCSIEKYGIQNHKFEIIETRENRDSLIIREREIVNEQLIKDPLCMNLKLGGEGGWTKKSSSNGGKKGGKVMGGVNFKKVHCRLKKDPDYKDYWCGRVSQGLVDHYAMNGYHWVGKKHKEETLVKQKNTFKEIGHQQGEKNSQYGTCWINNGKENKKIKKEFLNEFLELDWVKGRKL